MGGLATQEEIDNSEVLKPNGKPNGLDKLVLQDPSTANEISSPSTEVTTSLEEPIETHQPPISTGSGFFEERLRTAITDYIAATEATGETVPDAQLISRFKKEPEVIRLAEAMTSETNDLEETFQIVSALKTMTPQRKMKAFAKGELQAVITDVSRQVSESLNQPVNSPIIREVTERVIIFGSDGRFLASIGEADSRFDGSAYKEIVPAVARLKKDYEDPRQLAAISQIVAGIIEKQGS